MTEIMKKIGFLPDETEFFLSLCSSLSKEILDEIEVLKNDFFMKDTDKDQIEVRDYVYDKLVELSEKVPCHHFSLHMLFLLLCTDELKADYKEKGYAEELFYDMMCDITYKLRECKKRHGIYGTTSFKWFHNEFLMKLFALGRFQYVKGPFRQEKTYTWGDVTVEPGDDVYYIHIPSSGPMTEDARLNSYKKAYEFLPKNKGKYMVYACDSWLLAPCNEHIFPENSNMMGFFKDFDILSSYETENAFSNAWRVFNMNFEGDVSVLPKETTLQKNYAKWLEDGNKVGAGYGIIIFDGEKIVNR